MSNNRGRHFQRGARGVFNCISCGRGTRVVDQGSDSCCSQCYELAGIDNMVNDDGGGWEKVQAECDALLAEIVKKGGDAAKVKASFEYLWPEPKAASVEQPRVTLDEWARQREREYGESSSVEVVAMNKTPRGLLFTYAVHHAAGATGYRVAFVEGHDIGGSVKWDMIA